MDKARGLRGLLCHRRWLIGYVGMALLRVLPGSIEKARGRRSLLCYRGLIIGYIWVALLGVSMLGVDVLGVALLWVALLGVALLRVALMGVPEKARGRSSLLYYGVRIIGFIGIS